MPRVERPHVPMQQPVFEPKLPYEKPWYTFIFSPLQLVKHIFHADIPPAIKACDKYIAGKITEKELYDAIKTTKGYGQLKEHIVAKFTNHEDKLADYLNYALVEDAKNDKDPATFLRGAKYPGLTIYAAYWSMVLGNDIITAPKDGVESFLKSIAEKLDEKDIPEAMQHTHKNALLAACEKRGEFAVLTFTLRVLAPALAQDDRHLSQQLQKQANAYYKGEQVESTATFQNLQTRLFT